MWSKKKKNKKSMLDLINFFFLLFFSLLLLSISRVLISNMAKEYKEVKERHIQFILKEKGNVLILNPTTFKYLDLICNTNINENKKKKFLEKIKEKLNIFNFNMFVYCMNGNKYSIKNKCNKKISIKKIAFPEYEVLIEKCE